MKKSNGKSRPQPEIGLVEWFHPGEHERVEAVLAGARSLGIRHLRTRISWADWHVSEGDGWYAWLLPRLARELQILPCVTGTPPSLGLVPKLSSPPVSPKSFADFIDVFITRFGDLFDWIELWNHPTNPREWDPRLDPDWRIFSEMVGGAAYWIRNRGKHAVLGGLWPTDVDWLRLMHQRGVLNYIDAVGLHGHPGAAEFPWSGWAPAVAGVRQCLADLGQPPAIWITLTGISTWRGDERAQVRAFNDALSAPVDRVYWRQLQDTPRTLAGPYSDEREYHYGLIRADSTPKLLFNLWSAGGLAAVRNSAKAPAIHTGASQKRVLITGGAGFIGTNLAARLLASGRSVHIYDNLSRPGTNRNLAWLQETYPQNLHVDIADVLDAHALRKALTTADQVFHLAAQVAVTHSLTDPRHDFRVNVEGTLNLLEGLRAMDHPPSLVFTSTNKVYGSLADLPLHVSGKRYQPLDRSLRTGVSESRPLDFHSPYGCSKGAADQYVIDFARTFGIPALVFRMSCIYGLHQNGNEDQGWVAHFLIRALEQRPLTIFGDGMQVRDLLFADDLVDAFLLAQANIHTLSGQAFNIGGGLGNTVSLLDLVDMLTALNGQPPRVRFEEWRAADQRYYVSDTRKFNAATGWAPTVSVHQGVRRVQQWLQETLAPRPAGESIPYGAANALFTH